MSKVTVIPQTRNIYTAQAFTSQKKRLVAGYARVSTDSDEQFTSYEAQVRYYTQFIQSKADWEFVKVYTDEGITGTNTRHRDGFNEMVADALAGKIDLIVTKSVSRFARNTVDSLVTIRKLKEHGCECFFEKANIYTFDGKGELLLTIMSSLAQEESRSISENVTWGQRKRFADGQFSMPYKRFLGYEKGEDGKPVINQEQAETVRLIYRLFFEGNTPSTIAQRLTKEKIPTPGGKEKWSSSTVTSILKNEKYKGDALLQKCFTVDFLTKKQKINEGEVPQYYVTGSHEAIIPPEEYDFVQSEMSRRKKAGRTYSGKNALSSKIICGDCGAFYGKKVWHSTDAHRCIIYRCNRKFDREEKCKTPTIREEEVHRGFLLAYNQLMKQRDEIVAGCQTIRETLKDTHALQELMDHYQEEMTLAVELKRQLIREKARKSMDAVEFDKKQEQYDARYLKAKEQYDAISEQIKVNQARDKDISLFIHHLKSQELILEEWDEQLWNLLVQDVTVYPDKRMVFQFYGGQAITIWGNELASPLETGRLA